MDLIIMDFASEFDNMRILNNDRQLTEEPEPEVQEELSFDADATLKWVARAQFQNESEKCKCNLVFQFTNYICDKNPIQNPEWFINKIYNDICEHSEMVQTKFFNYKRDVKHITCKPQHMIIKVTFEKQQKAEMFYKLYTNIKTNLGCLIFPDRPLSVRRAKHLFANVISQAQKEEPYGRLTWQNGYLYFGNKFIVDLLPYFCKT